MSEPMEKQMAGLLDLLALRNEPLHPDLVPYLTKSTSGYPLLAHPLVHHIMPINGQANRAYLYAKEQLEEAIDAQDWHSVVFTFERPYRTDALIDYVTGRVGDTDEVAPVSRYDSQEVRDLVVDVWTDSENIHQHVDDWMRLTSDWLPGHPLLFASEKEAAEFEALPDTLTLWRGDCNDGGWSWSLDRKVGEFFAKRWSENHALLTGTVDKRNVFGFITRRNEAEVMVRREFVRDIKTTIVSGNEE